MSQSPTPTPQLNGNSAAHTPGPWRLGTIYKSVVADSETGCDHPNDIAAYGGHLVCESVMREANAHRIVACVNACEGINPEAVKDLLAACKAALPMLESAYFDDEDGDGDPLTFLRAAIAKATGGAA